MAINILVGDIGSTKSTWWTNSEDTNTYSLPGYNPVAHDPEVGTRMLEQLWHVTEGALFESIWYYGSGILNDNVALRVKTEISKFFPRAAVHVGSDVLGAAIAACGQSEGTIVILGTGSHAAIYDGKKIVRQANSLGYILGDEAGGSDIGKCLVQAYFYNQMPEEIEVNMQKMMTGGRGEFLHKLYSSHVPNQFLAEYVKVAVHHLHDPWMQKLLLSRFNLFIQNHLIPLVPKSPVHVIGSIGTIFAGLFQDALETYGFQLGELIQDPSQRLFEMHLKHDRQA